MSESINPKEGHMAPCNDCGNNDLPVGREGKCGECRTGVRYVRNICHNEIVIGERAVPAHYRHAPPLRCGWCGHDDYDCVCNGGK